MVHQKASKAKRRRALRRVLLLTVLAALCGGCLYGFAALARESAPVYEAYTAQTGSIASTLSFGGTLQIADSQTAVASADGTVRAVYVREGDMVSAGDRLLRLSSGETITAALDGRVNQLTVDVGDEVLSGDSLIEVADFARQAVSFRVDEYDVGAVSVGDDCTVTVTATGRQFASTIATLDYISASPGKVAYYTAIAYVTGAEGVYPGMQATVSVAREQAENVVTLPVSALSFHTDGSAYVYRKGADGAMDEAAVEPGVSDGRNAAILSGLSAGETVYAPGETQAQESALDSLLRALFGSTRVNEPVARGTMNGFPGRNGGEAP